MTASANISLSSPSAAPSMSIIEGLGLTLRSVEGVPLPQRRIDELASRQLPFDWIHMGTSLCTVATLERVILEQPTIIPPRSGHIGNWTDIADGRAGAIDYNKVICEQTALGVPLIYEFTMTEDEALKLGDTIYLPGSYVRGGRREILPLYSWGGSDFIVRDRAIPRLVPFVLTPDQGQLISLVEFHRRRCSNLSSYDFQSQAGLIRKNETLLREVLRSLIVNANRQADPGKALGLVFDRVASCDGSVRRASWSVHATSYHCDADAFGDANTLLDCALLPFVAASEPDQVADDISHFARAMPLCSSPLISLLLAIFNSHVSDPKLAGPHHSAPFNIHPHWGAIGMAGYPPRRSGHFADHVRYGRKLYQTIIRDFQAFSPVYFVLLPAAIYLLWPQEHFARDVELVANLINDVRRKTDTLLEKTNILYAEISLVVQQWLQEVRGSLSAYFVNRFASQRSVFNDIHLPPPGQCLRPAGFNDLTLRQASMMVGALFEHVA
jgi:Family of unknown function (DUF6025)